MLSCMLCATHNKLPKFIVQFAVVIGSGSGSDGGRWDGRHAETQTRDEDESKKAVTYIVVEMATTPSISITNTHDTLHVIRVVLLSWVSESDMDMRALARECMCMCCVEHSRFDFVAKCGLWRRCRLDNFLCILFSDRIVNRICNIFTSLVCFITFYISHIISFTYSFLYSSPLRRRCVLHSQWARPAILFIFIFTYEFSESCVRVWGFCVLLILAIAHHKEKQNIAATTTKTRSKRKKREGKKAWLVHWAPHDNDT